MEKGPAAATSISATAQGESEQVLASLGLLHVPSPPAAFWKAPGISLHVFPCGLTQSTNEKRLSPLLFFSSARHPQRRSIPAPPSLAQTAAGGNHGMDLQKAELCWFRWQAASRMRPSCFLAFVSSFALNVKKIR